MKLNLTPEEARNVVWNGHPDWEAVPKTETIHDQGRWTTTVSEIHRHIPTNKFFEFIWERGSTEYQEMKPFENESVVPIYEVHLVEKTVKVWEEVTDDTVGLSESN